MTLDEWQKQARKIIADYSVADENTKVSIVEDLSDDDLAVLMEVMKFAVIGMETSKLVLANALASW